MKTTVTIFLVLLSSFASSLFCQSTSTKEYLKATNNLWNICYDFRIIKDSEESNTDRNSALPTIKRNVENAKKEYGLLSSKFPNDPDVKKLDTWIKTVESCYVSLKGEKWQTEPVWQLGFSLIEMDLKDFVNDNL
ncbi:hypothetical protein K0U91_06735 [Chryseobacterium chendengshani]|uniref:hypothetical protein n=1 Tax=Chryseobacterium sp. LJ668 TaxID=2864040 RepID=UPI001C68B01E|nr:hypothetical protein [Chryseobacterium sp. LJ668]MBW8522162.1 hypothetical protein [Chryseobacterium sp. LJ668]QYK17808.1 hypothetical protein K0U91_06735 [Chryseobacterium sp. LJ668]